MTFLWDVPEARQGVPGAHRLGLPDFTGSGPKLFALLVAHGVLAAMASPRVVPAALALVAGVSPLLQVRSARQWTLWLGQLREPSSAIAAVLREQTPTSQISLAPPSSARPLRAAALRDDRDRLAAELLSATRELARLRDLGRATKLGDFNPFEPISDRILTMLRIGSTHAGQVQRRFVLLLDRCGDRITIADPGGQGLVTMKRRTLDAAWKNGTSKGVLWLGTLGRHERAKT